MAVVMPLVLGQDLPEMLFAVWRSKIRFAAVSCQFESGGVVVFVDQAAEDGSSADLPGAGIGQEGMYLDCRLGLAVRCRGAAWRWR